MKNDNSTKQSNASKPMLGDVYCKFCHFVGGEKDLLKKPDVWWLGDVAV